VISVHDVLLFMMLLEAFALLVSIYEK